MNVIFIAYLLLKVFGTTWEPATWSSEWRSGSPVSSDDRGVGWDPDGLQGDAGLGWDPNG